jgi:hypothetical protein
MTTKAGLIGILSGILATLILVYPLAINKSYSWIVAGAAGAALVVAVGGFLAARWSGSVERNRCAALGSLAGGLAGTLVFCWLGAAQAGLLVIESKPHAAFEAVTVVIRQTQTVFLVCFVGGILLGAIAGWLAHPRRGKGTDQFDKSAPQMALNASITALPACVVAATAFAALNAYMVYDTHGSRQDLSLGVPLLLVLISHSALLLVVPHEARQAEHRCGMDEVKMAAYVGIAAAPVLAFLLFLADGALLTRPLILGALLVEAVSSVRALQHLLGSILPGRTAFPTPQNSDEQAQAALFGSIAESHAPRLVVLCLGCGMMMVLPFHVTVVATLVNLASFLVATNGHFPIPAGGVAYNLYLFQFLVSSGLMVTASAILIGIYMLYLYVGRWFKRRASRTALIR